MDFVNGVDGYERFGVGLFHVAHQCAIFLRIYNGDDLTEGFAGVSADGFHNGSTAVQSIQNISESRKKQVM